MKRGSTPLFGVSVLHLYHPGIRGLRESEFNAYDVIGLRAYSSCSHQARSHHMAAREHYYCSR